MTGIYGLTGLANAMGSAAIAKGENWAGDGYQSWAAIDQRLADFLDDWVFSAFSVNFQTVAL